MARSSWVLLMAIAVLSLGAMRANPAGAHCDGLDGPVVKAARAALAQGDVSRVLIWVQAKDEVAIRRAFERTLSVRKLGPAAQELADTYFFETLVRIHRAGEGAPYTGLAPAGRDLGPAIPAADRALESGDVGALGKLLVNALHRGLSERFEAAISARSFGSQDVEAGRRYVEKYVTFVHYVEGLYEAASRQVEGHYAEGDSAPHAH